MTRKTKLAFFLLAVFGFQIILIGRLFYLQVYQHDFFLEKSTNQLKRIIKLYPHRGNIYDRNRYPLALTQTVYSLYAIPPKIESVTTFSQTLAPILNMDAGLIQQLVSVDAPFVWVKRKLSQSEYTKLRELDWNSFNFIQEEKRVYPNRSLAAQALGFVGIDNQGLAGLEYEYDDFLKGTEGKIIMEGDPRGHLLVSGRKTTIDPEDGGDIITTLDTFIQFSAQRHLQNGILENDAIAGHAIVMNPQNGDILALVSIPSFDPNQWSNVPRQNWRNRTVTDIYEPGSVLKIVTLAGILEEGIMTPDTVLDVPETYTMMGHTIKEAFPRKPDAPDAYTVTEIIKRSLNVGTTKLALALGKPTLHRYYERFGFGSKLGVQLPGESSGLLRNPAQWSGIDIAMMSFGQGIGATPLQVAAAASAVANGGTLPKPRLVRYVTRHHQQTLKATPVGGIRRVISEQTAEKIRHILIQVVEDGSGVLAQIPGYAVAGKTGTAQKAKPNGLGYDPDHYIASFLGFFPANDPMYLILIIVDSPKKSIWGSSVAAPIFRNIAVDIIDHFNIPPDQPVFELRR